MTALELEDQVRKLEFLIGKATPAHRGELRSGVERIIQRLREQDQAIPPRLRRIEAALDEEEDDFFENMPV